jgi:hypothetical protein
MLVKQLEKEARKELEIEKKDLAKEILKERIREITKAENVLQRLKAQYSEILNKPVDTLTEEAINGRIRF